MTDYDAEWLKRQNDQADALALADLYDAEVAAYRHYVEVKTGADLVLANAHISPTRVEAARQEWLTAWWAFTDAGGRFETARTILAERHSPDTEVRRSR